MGIFPNNVENDCLPLTFDCIIFSLFQLYLISFLKPSRALIYVNGVNFLSEILNNSMKKNGVILLQTDKGLEIRTDEINT
jgi:hypothetical protein